MNGSYGEATVVVVGGGFAGVACAKGLAKAGVRVTLIDRHDYAQFQPLLYQVATAQVNVSEVARPMRQVFRKGSGVTVQMATITAVDPVAKTVTSSDGITFAGDYLVLAMGSEPNFHRTPGAETNAFSLYSLEDAQRLRSRLLTVFEDASRNPKLIDQGALNFVIVGAGATGVETAGALADALNRIIPRRIEGSTFDAARIYLIDPGAVVLAPFSERSHAYAQEVLEQRGVRVELGLSAAEIGPDRVTLSDGRVVLTRTVVWAGGVQAAALATQSGLPAGDGGRLEVAADLTVMGAPGIYALGDVANTPGPDGRPFPQLGSVALQAGRCAAENILADIDGRPRSAFRYRDKGMMAMIGRNAAVAEVGPRRRALHGPIAFASWLGVHAWLLSGFRARVFALASWGLDYVANSRPSAIIDRPDAAHIDWD